MFLRFAMPSWSSIYGSYDANNHVLYALLERASFLMFGISEFSLRLPSVIAGFFLILGLLGVLRIVTASIVVRWVALAGLSLYPLLLDFSVAARGYGLSVALLVWSIYFLFGRRYLWSGVLLGLAISANLVIAFPALALAAAMLLFDKGAWTTRLKRAAGILACAAMIFGLICAAAFRTAHLSHFYAGVSTLRESVWDAVIQDIIGAPDAVQVAIEFVVAPAAAIFLAFAYVRDMLRGSREKRRWMPAAMLAVTVAGLFAAHFILGFKYPPARMTLHLAVLFGIAWAVAVDSVAPLRAANLALALLFVIEFATLLQVRYFSTWYMYRNDRAVGAVLRERSVGRAEGSVRISSYWPHQDALEFYRVCWRVKEWQPVMRHDPMELGGNDFYVLDRIDAEKIGGVRVFYRDEENDVTVAESSTGQPR